MPATPITLARAEQYAALALEIHKLATEDGITVMLYSRTHQPEPEVHLTGVDLRAIGGVPVGDWRAYSDRALRDVRLGIVTTLESMPLDDCEITPARVTPRVGGAS